MNFRAPSPILYLSSLVIAIIFTSLAYWILDAQDLTHNSMLVIVCGLVIGHLIGVCAMPSAKKPASTARKTDSQPSTASSDGDTISLYVGNLAYNTQRDDLRELFKQYGKVHSARIMTDRATRRPRGYGFVEMDANSAREALAKLDNTDFNGRTLRVSEAKQRQ